MALFEKKFGRSMQPSDPLFFYPDADVPQLIDEAKVTRVVGAARRLERVPQRRSVNGKRAVTLRAALFSEQQSQVLRFAARQSHRG